MNKHNVLHATNYGWRQTTGRYSNFFFLVNYGIHKHSPMEERNNNSNNDDDCFILDTKRTQTISMCSVCCAL